MPYSKKLYFGMAQWQHPAWVGWLYSSHSVSNLRLADYAMLFNTVEVGSSFYTELTNKQLLNWYEQVPDTFRFSFKVPQTVTHSLSSETLSISCEVLDRFSEQLAPFVSKLGVTMMQFPTTVSSDALPLIEELCQRWQLPTPLSIEVRHLSFFDKRENESAFLSMLAAHGKDRVIMDSRPVFSTQAYCDSLVDAQKKKPKVPCHPVRTNRNPVVRFVGHPDLQRNDKYLDQWASKLVDWLKLDVEPYVFIHSSDNVAAPLLAVELEKRVAALYPQYQPWLNIPQPQQQATLL